MRWVTEYFECSCSGLTEGDELLTTPSQRLHQLDEGTSHRGGSDDDDPDRRPRLGDDLRQFLDGSGGIDLQSVYRAADLRQPQRYGIGGTRCCSFAGNVKNTVLAVVTSRS